jgi:hypothetical protein
LKLHPEADGQLKIDVLKCRGARSGFSFRTSAVAAAAQSSRELLASG